MSCHFDKRPGFTKHRPTLEKKVASGKKGKKGAIHHLSSVVDGAGHREVGDIVVRCRGGNQPTPATRVEYGVPSAKWSVASRFVALIN